MTDTRYALSQGNHIAYQVHGTGDRDLIFVSDWLIHVEAMWDIGPYARFLERLAALGRLIVFDMLGTGLSDPVPPGAARTLDDWMDDMRAVLDAAGSERVALLSFDSAGVMATLFAATYPERTSGLILFNSFARLVRDDENGMGSSGRAARSLTGRSRWSMGYWTQPPGVSSQPSLRRGRTSEVGPL